MLDPKAIKLAADVVAKSVKAGVLTFAEVVERISDAIGREATLKLAPMLEKMWLKLSEADRTGQIGRVTKTEDAFVARAEDGTLQMPYQARSKQPGANTLVPRNMQESLSRALVEVEKAHGPVDTWVASELGWTNEQLAQRLLAEQVDAVALAMHNIGQGRGFIIGDQTGIGKGRVAAAILEWGRRQGHTPIFVTAKADLFRDMMRDLTAIGSGSFRPFITKGQAKKLPLDDGRTLSPPTDPRAEAAAMLETGRLGDAYDGIFTTYSQAQPVKGQPTWRHVFLRAMARGAILVLDESHNAGGTEGARQWGRAEFLREIQGETWGVLYSSATYAKRPEVMDLYWTTDMSKAVGGDPAHLADAIQTGGVPLQQVTAIMLTESGQYARRERDWREVREFRTTKVAVKAELADNVGSQLRNIYAFDRLKQAIVRGMDRDLKAEARRITGDQSTGDAGAKSTSFGSIMHNLIAQYLLAAKTQGAVDCAIELIKAGEKPVIVVSNTVGAAIDRFVQEHAVQPGQGMGITFGALLERYLERSREVNISDVAGRTIRHRLTDEELGEDGAQLYADTLKSIRETNLGDVPISPIDWIHFKLAQAGYKVGEITGRHYTLEYAEKRVPLLGVRAAADRSEAGKIRIINEFNAGELDGLVINRAGSEGISIHASREFADQKPRHMIILQADPNIDTFMQVLGRINRTGQVVGPAYTLLMSDIPAEKRPAAVLLKKLASLNANVTAGREGGVQFRDVPDIMNDYGDEVVATFLEANPEIHEMLGNPVKEGDEGLEREKAANKATGHVAMLPVAEQEAFYDAIEAEYKEHIAYLDSIGQNALRARDLDLRAETLSVTPFTEGIKGDPSPFAQGSQIETVRVRRLGKPMLWPQVLEILARESELPQGVDVTLEHIAAAGHAQRERRTERAYAEFQTFLAEQIEAAPPEQQAGVSVRLEGTAAETLSRLRSYYIGQQIELNIQTSEDRRESDVYYGVIARIAQKGTTKNPLAASNWKVTVIVADAARQIEFPISKTISIVHDRSAPVILRLAEPRNMHLFLGANTMLDAFAKAQSVGHEQRLIVTGNLLAAYDGINKGQIVTYTDSAGNLKQGILLPKNVNLDRILRTKSQKLATPEEAIHAAQHLAVRDSLQTPDGALRLIRLTDKLYELRAARARTRGGRFYLNRTITDITGEFVSSGGDMVAQADRTDLNGIIRAVYNGGDQLQVSGGRQAPRSGPAGPHSGPLPGPAPAPPPAATPARGELIGIREMRQAFEKLFRHPIRTGRFRQRAAGLYFPWQQISRTKRYGYLTTMAHEVSHHVYFREELWRKIPRALHQELKDLDYKPHKQRLHEGFAEFGRMFLTEPKTAEAAAPNFYRWFNATWLPGSDWAEAYSQGQRLFARWTGQTPMQKTLAQMDFGTSRGRSVLAFFADLRGLWDRLLSAWVNRQQPLHDAEKLMAARAGLGRLPTAESYGRFAKVANMRASAVARYMVEQGMVNVTGQRVGPSLKEALEPVMDQIGTSEEARREFEAFMFARHAVDLAKAGKESGLSLRTAEAVVRDCIKRPGWEKAADAITKWHDGLLDYLIAAGQLNPDAKKRMRELYPHYVPKLISLEDTAAWTRGERRRYANVARAIRRLKGSSERIIPPLEASVMYAERIVSTADRVRVGLMLVNAAEKYGGMADIIVKVPPDLVPVSRTVEDIKRQLEQAGADLTDADMDAVITLFQNVWRADNKDHVVVLWRNGKQEMWQVNSPQLWKAIVGLNEQFELPRILEWVFGKAAKAVRLAATGLRPAFSFWTNPMRDPWTAMMQTEVKGWRGLPPVTFVRGMKGIMDDIFGTKVAELWKAGGGEMAQPLGIDRIFNQDLLSKILARGPLQKAAYRARHPIEATREVFSVTELGPRIAEFEAIIKQLGWQPGHNLSFEQFVEAQLAAANVTVDFREGGWFAMWLNRIVPFHNASIQGPNRMIQTIRKHPLRSLLRAMPITVLSLGLWWAYKDEEWFKELPPYERWRYWHIKIGRHTIRIPRPFEWGWIFGSLPEASAESAYRKTPQAVTEALKEGMEIVAPPILPPALQVPAELAFNYDIFRGRPIVSRSLAALNPEEQYYAWNTRTARRFGELFGISPAEAEHALRAFTGDVILGSIGTAEWLALPAAGRPPKTMADIPIFGRAFLRPETTRVFDDMYSQHKKLEAALATARRKGQSEALADRLRHSALSRVARALSERRKRIQNIIDSETPDADRRKGILAIRDEMSALAKAARDNQLAFQSVPLRTERDFQNALAELWQAKAMAAAKIGKVPSESAIDTAMRQTLQAAKAAGKAPTDIAKNSLSAITDGLSEQLRKATDMRDADKFQQLVRMSNALDMTKSEIARLLRRHITRLVREREPPLTVAEGRDLLQWARQELQREHKP